VTLIDGRALRTEGNRRNPRYARNYKSHISKSPFEIPKGRSSPFRAYAERRRRLQFTVQSGMTLSDGDFLPDRLRQCGRSDLTFADNLYFVVQNFDDGGTGF
jgi:hypothetical protein